MINVSEGKETGLSHKLRDLGASPLVERGRRARSTLTPGSCFSHLQVAGVLAGTDGFNSGHYLPEALCLPVLSDGDPCPLVASAGSAHSLELKQLAYLPWRAMLFTCLCVYTSSNSGQNRGNLCFRKKQKIRVLVVAHQIRNPTWSL